MKINSPTAQSIPATGAAKNMQPVAGLDSAKKESVGDIANRAANAAGAASGRRIQGQGNPKLDKDAFFKLMLTHLKNQDPTSPLKSHEMAAQLAQFSSLEQMSNINEVLKDMNKGQSSNGQYQAMDLIGKTVSGDSSRIDRAKGDVSHAVSFALNEPASEVKIAIKDGEGKVVKNFELQNQPRGTVKIDWDGNNIEGRPQAQGSYSVHVSAKAASGNKLPVDMKFKGQVTGIQFTEKGPIVFVGNKQIPLKEIKQIELAEEKNINANQMSMAPRQMGAMDPQQALQSLAKDMSGTSSPISDPAQDILATAVLNQKMKNEVL